MLDLDQAQSLSRKSLAISHKSVCIKFEVVSHRTSLVVLVFESQSYRAIVLVARYRPLGANMDRESELLFVAVMLVGTALATIWAPQQTLSLLWALLAGAFLLWASRKRAS